MFIIGIAGGTGSGKTTFLNALSDYIPKSERIITIEDSAELQIENGNYSFIDSWDEDEISNEFIEITSIEKSDDD